MNAETYISLTPEQWETLKPLVDLANEAWDRDEPIMIIGQLSPFRDERRVYFAVLPTDTAAQVQKIVSPKAYEKYQAEMAEKRARTREEESE